MSQRTEEQKKALVTIMALIKEHKLSREDVDDALIAANTHEGDGHWESGGDDEWEPCGDDNPHYDPTTGIDLALSCEQAGEDENHRWVPGPAPVKKGKKKARARVDDEEE